MADNNQAYDEVIRGLGNAYAPDLIKDQLKLKVLGQKPTPQFTADPTLLKYYQMQLRGVNNPQGLTYGEKANYNQDVTNNVNTQMYNATNTSGGNLARYIRTALQPSVISSSNQLVGRDQQIKRSNYNNSMSRLGTATSAIQGIGDRNMQNEYNYRIQTEQALGNSVLQQKRYEQEKSDNMWNDILGTGVTLGLGYLTGGASLGLTGANAFSKKKDPNVGPDGYYNRGWVK